MTHPELYFALWFHPPSSTISLAAHFFDSFASKLRFLNSQTWDLQQNWSSFFLLRTRNTFVKTFSCQIDPHWPVQLFREDIFLPVQLRSLLTPPLVASWSNYCFGANCLSSPFHYSLSRMLVNINSWRVCKFANLTWHFIWEDWCKSFLNGPDSEWTNLAEALFLLSTYLMSSDHTLGKPTFQRSIHLSASRYHAYHGTKFLIYEEHFVNRTVMWFEMDLNSAAVAEVVYSSLK